MRVTPKYWTHIEIFLRRGVLLPENLRYSIIAKSIDAEAMNLEVAEIREGSFI